MARGDAGRDEIRDRLRDAIGELRRQLLRVEVWAEALDGFSRPVPGYTPDNEYSLPRQRGKAADTGPYQGAKISPKFRRFGA